MKNKITLLAIIAVVMTTSIFANPVKMDINNQVMNSFTQRFEGAKEVTWNKADQYLKASFTKDGQAMSAYFNNAGELIGIVRNILSQQLPTSLNIELKKAVSNGWISELFEFTTDEETSYFVTIEDADQKLHFKSISSNEWVIYKKGKKN